jgi:3-oxoadipate enol-lactonase
MAVEVDGQGDPAVMIHGLGGTSNTFSPLMGLLGSRFRVIRPDLPGSGRSTASAVLSIQGFVDRIVAVTHALGVHRAHFAGHSLGTIVCLHLAAQQPSLVRSLALFGPLLALTDAARRSIRDRATVVRAEGMQSTADTIVQGTLAADTRATRPVSAALVREMLMRQDPEGYARTCEALAEGVAPIPQAIGCPCLLVTGDEDPVAPPASVRAMADRIVGARTIVLSRCGHWATFERPVEVMKALADFYFGSAIRAATERRPARHSARIT